MAQQPYTREPISSPWQLKQQSFKYNNLRISSYLGQLTCFRQTDVM